MGSRTGWYLWTSTILALIVVFARDGAGAGLGGYC